MSRKCPPDLAEFAVDAFVNGVAFGLEVGARGAAAKLRTGAGAGEMRDTAARGTGAYSEETFRIAVELATIARMVDLAAGRR